MSSQVDSLVKPEEASLSMSVDMARVFEAWYDPKTGWVVFYRGNERVKSFALGGFQNLQAAKDNIRADLASGIYQRFGYCLRNTSVHVCGETA